MNECRTQGACIAAKTHSHFESPSRIDRLARWSYQAKTQLWFRRHPQTGERIASLTRAPNFPPGEARFEIAAAGCLDPAKGDSAAAAAAATGPQQDYSGEDALDGDEARGPAQPRAAMMAA